MLPLIEMLMQADNGKQFSQLQEQFGLDAKQTEQALGAVLPAFSTGLKRNTSAPQGFGAFMQAISTGQHTHYIDNKKSAFDDEGRKEGNKILGHLFGSKDTSRAVAKQAAKSSGVGESVIKKMLPVLASMVMGGVAKQAHEQNGSMNAVSNSQPANALGGGILGQILGELAKGGLNKPNNSRPDQYERSSRGNNPLGDLLDQMMNGNSRQPGRPSGDNPLGTIFEEMLNNKRGNYSPGTSKNNDQVRPRNDIDRPDYDAPFEDIGPASDYEVERPTYRDQKPPARKPNAGGLEDLFGDMFETGRQVDKGYQRDVDTIFDKFLKR